MRNIKTVYLAVLAIVLGITELGQAVASSQVIKVEGDTEFTHDPSIIKDGDTWYVFRLKTRERADPSKLDDAEKKSLRERLEGQRQGELYQSWLDRLRKKSKIVENVAMLDYDTQPGHETFNPDDF